MIDHQSMNNRTR